MKIAMVCDNYKVKKFEEEFAKHKFVYTVVGGITKTTTAFEIFTYSPTVVKKVCDEVEIFFGGQKAKCN